MEYQFVRHQPFNDKILFVLALDRKKLKERILIGEELQIRFRLNGNTDTDVLCDITRPLGTFITGFENDPDGDWNRCGLMPLYNALHTNRWKQPGLEQTASEFLSGKFHSSDPVQVYAACRVWDSYLKTREVRERSSASEIFLQKMSTLTNAFHTDSPLDFDPDTGRPSPFNLSSRIFGYIPSSDLRLDLWYPGSQHMVECVSAYASFYPLLIYYMNRLADWGLCFCKCKICGKVFLAKSLRYELCSDKCRKKQSLQNKREFDQRARENSYDLLYKNECQNWRNKINRAKRTAGFPDSQIDKMDMAFSSFKQEALRRKKLVKEGKARPQEFTDWLYQQAGIITGLADIR